MRWELLSSQDKDFVLAEAVERGWGQQKVQVKKYFHNNETIWTIEPYEEHCGCSNLINYQDYIEGNV